MRDIGIMDRRHWPSVTVVVPSGGHRRSLWRAVRSILAQRYEGEIECVVCLDGVEQVDRPLAGESNGSGRSLRTIINDRGVGPAGARNAGALVAEGELLAFCDDDDEWLPEKLQEQVTALRCDGQPSVVSSGVSIQYGHRSVERIPSKETVMFHDLLVSRMPELHTSTFLVRREDFLGEIGPMDEDLPGGVVEEYEWLLRAARCRPVLAVRKPLTRIHWETSAFGGLGSSIGARWHTRADALRYLLQKYPEFQEEPRGLARVCGQIAFAYAAGGHGAEARSWARKCLSVDRSEARGYLAFLVSIELLPPGPLLHLLRLAGRGI